MGSLDRDWAQEFPILGRKTYLASHSLGAVPRTTRDALEEFYEAWDTLGIQAWEGPWWNAVGTFTADVERLLNAPEGTTVPVQNATRGMAGVASALDYSGPRNKIVMTDIEFTTSYPFWGAQQRLGAEVVVVDSEDGVTVPAEALVEAIDERTLLVHSCQVYFRSGTLFDHTPVVKAAHDAGAMFLLDGYQAVGSVPTDVRALDVDFYVAGSHKYLCGGPGAGFLYVRGDRIAQMRPRLTGWFGMQDPFGFEQDLDGSTLHAGVLRFMDGTPNVPALFSARQGIRTVLDVGVDAIRKRSLALTARAIERADALGLKVRTPRADASRGGMLCLQFDGSEEATRALVAQDIVVDWRPECGLRLGPHFYNSTQDVDVLFEALEALPGIVA
jgi:kynureninase